MTCRIAFIAIAVLVCGCARTDPALSRSSSRAVEAQSSTIVGRWKLVSVDGISVASGKVILVFESGGAYRRQVSCNQGLGTFRLTGSVLSLGAVGETERGCDPYENEALIDEAVRVGPWTVTAPSADVMLLSGKHRLNLQRTN